MLRRGFTLIELLIVVAIIAILAAIAVPNFLEAQVRSKISRCKADMRSLELAEEAYRVDNNKYTLDNLHVNGGSGPALPDMQSWVMLTTPIAYMSSIPMSPFREYKTKTYAPPYTGGDVNPGSYLEYWLGNWSGTPPVFKYDSGCDVTGIYWRASSVGPDNLSDFHTQYLPSGATSFSPVDIMRRNYKFVNCIYDPTNGTTSRGDFFIANIGFIQ